jgi:ribonuclease Y
VADACGFYLFKILYELRNVMEPYILILIGALVGGGAFFMGWSLNARSGQNKIMDAQERAKKIVEEAEKEAITAKREKLLEVKDEWYQKKKDFESDAQSKRSKLQAYEKQLSNREENLEKKLDLLTKKESTLQTTGKEIADRQKRLIEHEKDLERLVEEENLRLEKMAGINREEAKKYLYQNLIETVKSEATQTLKDIRDTAKITAKKEAQKTIVQAIQRSAVDFTLETTVSVLNVGTDEMKGRIIGREGRNIRAFEAATGIDVIVDDTPEAVILSGFDPFRREVARVSLERLIADGRIHPARIEEVVEKVKKELEEEVIHTGENTLLEIGLHGAHPEIIKHIGRMKYRSSYGQNLLEQSIEVAYLTGIMSSELGLDPVLGKRAGLLHDIGKTIDKSVEGPHALLGYELCKKYNEHAVVCNAVGSHHEDIPMEHPISALVQAADAISGARPGARRESVEEYIKRLEKLENIAKSFNGVINTYAIQAGREVRVIVSHEKLDDAAADQLSHDIANKIEQEMEYPGQIKVVVVREFRSVSIAK